MNDCGFMLRQEDLLAVMDNRSEIFICWLIKGHDLWAGDSEQGI
jgi:hypothetical protein